MVGGHQEHTGGNAVRVPGTVNIRLVILVSDAWPVSPSKEEKLLQLSRVTSLISELPAAVQSPVKHATTAQCIRCLGLEGHFLAHLSASQRELSRVHFRVHERLPLCASVPQKTDY